jgi:hypothetical protein
MGTPAAGGLGLGGLRPERGVQGQAGHGRSREAEQGEPRLGQRVPPLGTRLPKLRPGEAAVYLDQQPVAFVGGGVGPGLLFRLLMHPGGRERDRGVPGEQPKELRIVRTEHASLVPAEQDARPDNAPAPLNRHADDAAEGSRSAGATWPPRTWSYRSNHTGARRATTRPVMPR